MTDPFSPDSSPRWKRRSKLWATGRSPSAHTCEMEFLTVSNLPEAESTRINDAKSRVPKAPQGRAAVSMNSFSNGLTAKTLILQSENPDQFPKTLNSYFDYLEPTNQIEVDLLAGMVAARWRLRRIWRFETAMLDIEMDSQAPDFEERFEKYDADTR